MNVRSKHRFILGGVSLALLVFAPVAFAVSWDLAYRVCAVTDESSDDPLPQLTHDKPIALGCEWPACCPGCPSTEAIDWKILIDATRVQSARLQFERLELDKLDALLVNNQKPNLDGNGIWLEPGETLITGLPVDFDGPTPLAFITANSAKQAGPTTGGTASSTSDFIDAIRVEQYRGDYLVSSSRLRLAWQNCQEPTAPLDRVVLENNASGDFALALLSFKSAAPGGCVQDRAVFIQDEYSPGNALQDDAQCRSEIAVFSDDNAIYFESPVSTWSDTDEDVHTISLAARIDVPVIVWLTSSSLEKTARDQMARADLIFNRNNIGIRLVPDYRDISENSSALAYVNGGCPDASPDENDPYVPSTINTYYVSSAFTGVLCTIDSNMIYVGSTADTETLAHELGHAFGLLSPNNGHVDDLAGFGTNNIMSAASPGFRTDFTLGQSFRINLLPNSKLNDNGNRSGVTRPCPPEAGSMACPALATDLLPH